MSAKKHPVSLTEAERAELTRLGKSQRRSERGRKRARLLLADGAEEGGADRDAAIAQQVKVAPLTRTRRRFAKRGLHKSLGRKEQETRKPRVLDGEAEAFLVATTCSAPPGGHRRWSLRLLRDVLIEQQIVDALGKEAVRQALKKRTQAVAEEVLVHPAPAERRVRLPHGGRSLSMEDMLAVYRRPLDAKRPLVCLDEAGERLLSDARPPVPMAAGQPARQDSGYIRNGTAGLFMVSAPLLGWRHVGVTDRRTCQDFAQVIKTLVDGQSAQADKVVLVLDNLNTHTLNPDAEDEFYPAGFGVVFAPPRSRKKPPMSKRWAYPLMRRCFARDPLTIWLEKRRRRSGLQNSPGNAIMMPVPDPRQV